MSIQPNHSRPQRPVASDSARADATEVFHSLLQFCQTSELPFGKFELEVMARMAVLGCCLIRLFLASRHERLDVQPYLRDGNYRLGDPDAPRKLKTFYGEVSY